MASRPRLALFILFIFAIAATTCCGGSDSEESLSVPNPESTTERLEASTRMPPKLVPRNPLSPQLCYAHPVALGAPSLTLMAGAISHASRSQSRESTYTQTFSPAPPVGRSSSSRRMEPGGPLKVLAQLESLGYTPDTCFPGQANRGTFPLDGAFSPDGQFLVFDGAVQQADRSGGILTRTTIAGDDLTLLVDLIPLDPARSYIHNFCS